MDIVAIKKLSKKEKVGFHQEGRNPKLILIGEEHTEKYLDFQEKIIEIVRPKAILHEAAQKEFLKIIFPLNPGHNNCVKRIFNWQDKYKIPILSLDIPYKNKRKKDVDDLRESILKIKKEFGIKEKSRSDTRISNAIREEIMVKNIIKYLKKFGNPLVVIVGCGHTPPYSVMVKNIAEKIDFISLMQSKVMLKGLRKNSIYFE